MTGEPYLYANGNPTTLSDPSGLCSVYSPTSGIIDDGRGKCQGTSHVAPKPQPKVDRRGPVFKDDGVSVTDVAGSVLEHGAKATGWGVSNSVQFLVGGPLCSLWCPGDVGENPADALKGVAVRSRRSPGRESCISLPRSGLAPWVGPSPFGLGGSPNRRCRLQSKSKASSPRGRSQRRQMAYLGCQQWE